MTDAALLRLEQAGAAPRLAQVSAECRAGTLLHIIGPNGAGKSTLLARMAGLLAGEGEIQLAGRALARWEASELAVLRAYLPQQQPPAALMPVFQYLSLHQPAAAREEDAVTAIGQLAGRLTLTDKLSAPLTHLSGGEWQRVRLAAVMLQVWPTLNPNGRLLLLDEPYNSLDVAQQAALDELLHFLCGAGRAVVACTHDLNHTLHHAERVWLLSAGRMIAQGQAEAVMDPELLATVFGVPFQRHAVDGRHWIVTRSA